MKRKQIPPEAIISLRQRLSELPPRSSTRTILVKETASIYGVSVDTVYRALRDRRRAKTVHRSDRGKLRKLMNGEMERYCEVIAAMKIRSDNKQEHHLSTARAIRRSLPLRDRNLGRIWHGKSLWVYQTSKRTAQQKYR